MTRRRLNFLPPANFWALAACLAAEFLVYDQIGSRRYTWIHPRWNDQVQYLTECYTGWEFAKGHGFWPGIWHTLTNPSAQGTLHDLAGVLIFTVAGGPSRSALLALEMLALMAWQAALFFGVARQFDSRALAWIAAALPLLLSWPWNGWAGSTADFRLDHLTMCVFGIMVVTALMTDRFRSRRWSAVFGAAVGVTLLTRFLTGAYLAPIFALGCAWSLASGERARRLLNLGLAAAIAFALAAPIFWLNREWIWNYYGMGHFVGPESIVRSAHMGWVPSIEFISANFFRRQLGPDFGKVAGGVTVFLVVLWLVFRAPRPAAKTEDDDASRVKNWLGLGAAFLVVPACVLTFESQKSEIVLSILVPGAIAVLVGAWAGLARRVFAAGAARAARWLLSGLAVAVAGFAASYFWRAQHTPALSAPDELDARATNRLADGIYAAAHDANLARPWIGVSEVSAGLDALVLTVICYERHHEWIPFGMTLPTGILAVDEKLIMERVAASDFFFLITDGPVSQWPFDQEARRVMPQIRAWCDANLREVQRYDIAGRRMVLYQRKEFPFAHKSL